MWTWASSECRKRDYCDDRWKFVCSSDGAMSPAFREAFSNQNDQNLQTDPRQHNNVQLYNLHQQDILMSQYLTLLRTTFHHKAH